MQSSYKLFDDYCLLGYLSLGWIFVILVIAGCIIV